MNGKHTPGPWAPMFSESVRIIDGDRHTVAIITNVTRFKRRDKEEVLANARLIAAAPDMYESLDFLLQGLLHIGNDSSQEAMDYAIARAEAALAKAKGEQS